MMWKNFATATGFIVVVLRAKMNVTSDSKSHSTTARKTTSGFYKSTKPIVIHNVAILVVILEAFSHNLYWKQRAYEFGSCAAIVCTCRSRAKIVGLVHLLLSFIFIAIGISLLWVRSVINYSILVYYLVLTSRLYPSTLSRLWITSYITNLKIGW